MPLHSEARKGHEMVARLLVDRGTASRGSRRTHLGGQRRQVDANISGADADEWTPLDDTAETGHEPLGRLLVDRGVDDDGPTPLYDTVKNGQRRWPGCLWI
jgi:ankyrin repeat protein